MRFKQFLLEMPQYNNNGSNPATHFEPLENQKLIVKKDDLELTSNGHYYTISYKLDGKDVGRMKLFNSEYMKNFPYVAHVKVHSSYRGKGIAKQMYDFCIEYFGGIVSGDSLTKDKDGEQGSFYVWKSLSKRYNTYYIENDKIYKVDDIDDKKFDTAEVVFVASKKTLTKKDVYTHITLNESYFEQLLEDKSNDIGLINYVGKNGVDKKLTTLDKEISKITIFENNEKKIVFGTVAKKISFSKEKDIEDKKEQLKDEEKLYKKEIKDYNESLKYYYDEVFEYKFLNDVDTFRKNLNSKIKYLASTTLILEILKKDLE